MESILSDSGILLGLEGVTGKKAVDSDAMTVKN
jgi:hypothetical protein